VAFTSPSEAVAAAGAVFYSDLFILDTYTREVKRITVSRRLWHPAINPRDGSVVAVSSLGPESCLVTVDPQSGEVRTLFRMDGSTVYNPVFSDDGGAVFFAMNIGGMQDIWTLPYPLESVPYDGNAAGADVNAAAARPITGPDSYGEYFPRYSNGTLLFASDRSGDLAVYALRAEGENALTAAEDPVGAYAGFLEAGEVIYAAYTEKGYALKRKAFSGFPAAGKDTVEAGGEPAVPDGPLAAQGAGTAAGTAGLPEPGGDAAGQARGDGAGQLSENGYHDLPKFQYWIPLAYSTGADGTVNTGSGAGALLVAASILGNNTLTAAITYDWWEKAVAFDFDGSSRLRKTTLGYGAYYHYANPGDAGGRHTVSLGISGSYPILEEWRFPRSFSLYATGELGRGLATPGTVSGLPEGRAGAGLVFSASRSGALKDFFEPVDLTVWAAAGAGVPLRVPAGSRFGIDAGGYVQVPSFIKHQVVGIGVDARYDKTEVFAPSGAPSPDDMAAGSHEPVRLTASVDYRFHIALLDLPLPFGYSLDRLAGGIFVETRAMAGIAGFSVDEDLYPGIELLAGYGSITHVPVGIGARFRIDPRNMSSFDLRRDTYLYVTAGKGGFVNRMSDTYAFLDAAGDGGYAVTP